MRKLLDAEKSMGSKVINSLDKFQFVDRLQSYFRLHLNATLQPPATRIKKCVVIHISTMVLIRNHRAFSILIDIYTAI